MGQNLALLVQADIRCALTVLPAGVCYKTVCLWVEEISIPFELTEDYYGNCYVRVQKKFFFQHPIIIIINPVKSRAYYFTICSPTTTHLSKTEIPAGTYHTTLA